MLTKFFQNHRSIIFVSILFLSYHFYLLLKIDPFDTLWAEDGPIFISQSLNLGWQSIFLPYAGYLHFDLRVVALFASFFDIRYAPIIFLVFWFICYFSFFLVWEKFAKSRGEDDFTIFLVALLVIFQVSSGERFFNLTNSHFFIAASTVLYLLTLQSSEKLSLFKLFLVSSFSITGPFSVLLSPILIAKSVLFKEWKTKKFFYIPVFFGALVQVLFIISSDRVSGHADPNLRHWVQSICNIFIVSSDIKINEFLLIAYWSIYFGSLGYFLCSSKRRNDAKLAVGIFGFIGIYVVSVLYASKDNPLLLSPTEGGSRYFFIPYSLFYVCLILFTDKKSKVRNSLILLAIIINAALYSDPIKRRTDLNYLEYADFFKSNATNYIPIQPQGWFITKDKKEFKGQKIDLLNTASYQKQCKNSKCLSFSDLKKACPNSRSLGLSLVYTGNLAANVAVKWSFDEHDFGAQNSLDLSHKYAVDNKLDFAFPGMVEKIEIYGKDLDDEKIEVKEINLFCL